MKKISNEDLIALDKPGDALTAFLREQNISLKPNELERVRELLERNPTSVELHIFNVMWSEHCSYKSSKALLKEYLPTEGPHVVLGPGEDAGIIRFYKRDGKQHCLVLAHESHNHPSQVLPVEGAATGIGGIVRDVYCMGADVIGVLDPLRFGDPDGPNAKRVRDIVRGVVEGIAQYGNALGVPNYGGETFFDASFDDNCLVNVVAIGAVEQSEIIRSRAPDQAAREAFDIILIGKPTDASGFGGAAFASERLSGDEAEERQEAVQVPDPFLKRVLVEASKVALAQARQLGVPIGFKDLGAGGISCAVSEMAQAGGAGADIDLEKVKRASTSLPAEVVACSETQERYAMFVPRSFTATVQRIYNEDFDLPHIYSGAGAYVIGHTTSDRRFRLRYGGRLVCDADVDAITTGIEYDREMKPQPRPTSPPSASQTEAPHPREALLTLLASYNVADKSILFQHYDSEVQGRAVLRPGEADAAVAIFRPGDPVGVAAGIGSHSGIGCVDPYLGGAWAVCEAVRNVACVGATPLAITDCLNYGDPEDPEVFWTFAEGVRGVGDACRGLRLLDETAGGVPVVSGNVSFYNQSGQGRPIAPTPIVACAGRVDDVSVCSNLGFKQVSSEVIMLGELHEHLGGSEYARLFGTADLVPPTPDFARESVVIRALVNGIREGAVLAAHDVGHGGLLVALAEMVLGSRPYPVGCAVVSLVSTPPAALFAEHTGVIVEIDGKEWPRFKKDLEKTGIPWHALGETVPEATLSLRRADEWIDVGIDELQEAHDTNGKCRGLFS
jgi:phosphoribosylformylglycinamidine synthase